MSTAAQMALEILEIEETDDVGRPTGTYILSSTHQQGSRFDMITHDSGQSLIQRVLSIFLPSGYPLSVSPDYARYQIYDSLQAFSSSIAGLLASRAVLQGIGVGDESASATGAMLLSIVQESMGRLATILFAHRAARRIEADCKMWRLAADVFNDAAFIMDCLSPSLPKPIRVPLLCASSMSRAVCGVAGGSSKAILSAHFAQSDNIGELNAKDSSQETVISLLGMWVGGLLVTRITSQVATWLWLLVLVTIHLATNHAAVRAVSMRTLNRQRANLTFSALISRDLVLSPEDVAKQERIFERDGVLRWQNGGVLGTCTIGVPLQHILNTVPSSISTISGATLDIQASTRQLFDLFRGEQYMLWFEPRARRTSIILDEHASGTTQLKAWCHALRVSKLYDDTVNSGKKMPIEISALLRTSLELNKENFEQHCKALEKAGWNLSTASLETNSGKRLRLTSYKRSH